MFCLINTVNVEPLHFSRSDVARKHGLSCSLLERLMTSSPYMDPETGEFDRRCVQKLVRNFRYLNPLSILSTSIISHWLFIRLSIRQRHSLRDSGAILWALVSSLDIVSINFLNRKIIFALFYFYFFVDHTLPFLRYRADCFTTVNFNLIQIQSSTLV